MIQTTVTPVTPDTGTTPVTPTTVSLPLTDVDDTTKDALELDCECCECLGTYQEDVDMGNRAEWVKCGCRQ